MELARIAIDGTLVKLCRLAQLARPLRRLRGQHAYSSVGGIDVQGIVKGDAGPLEVAASHVLAALAEIPVASGLRATAGGERQTQHGDECAPHSSPRAARLRQKPNAPIAASRRVSGE